MSRQDTVTNETPAWDSSTSGRYAGRRSLARRLRESPVSAGAISIAIHLVAFAVLLRIVWQDRPPPPRQIIAEAWLGPAGGGSSGGPGKLQPSTPGQDRPKPAETPPVAAANVPRSVAGSKDDDLKRLIGTLDAGAQETLAAASSGKGETSGMGLGLGGAGEGLPGGGAGGSFGGVSGDGPASGFFGQRGNAYKVVYVIDTSGSLGWMFEPVQRALIESIDQLRPTQSFHVIFAGSKPVELPARKLVAAIAAHKEPAKKFIRGLSSQSECDPVSAMERAFAVKPELIYFLTDGDFRPEIVQELLARLREWNADKRVHVTTIGFGVKLAKQQVAGQPVGEAVLRQIAQEHGGNFRWVDPEETEGRK